MHCIALHYKTRQDKIRHTYEWEPIMWHLFIGNPCFIASYVCQMEFHSYPYSCLIYPINKHRTMENPQWLSLFHRPPQTKIGMFIPEEHQQPCSICLKSGFYRENSRTGHILFFVAHPAGGFPDFLCWLNCEFDWICGILRYVLAFYEYLPPINSGINHLSTLCLIIFVMDIFWETIHIPSEDPGVSQHLQSIRWGYPLVL
jgi:hypothetical protein